jgi:hypothetical protein
MEWRNLIHSKYGFVLRFLVLGEKIIIKVLLVIDISLSNKWLHAHFAYAKVESGSDSIFLNLLYLLYSLLF